MEIIYVLLVLILLYIVFIQEKIIDYKSIKESFNLKKTSWTRSKHDETHYKWERSKNIPKNKVVEPPSAIRDNNSTPKEIDGNLIIKDKLGVGKNFANYKLHVNNSIYAKEHCFKKSVDNKKDDYICLNQKDMRGVHLEPSNRDLCIGDTCINKTDIGILKSMSTDVQKVNINSYPNCHSYFGCAGWQIVPYKNSRNKIKAAHDRIDNLRLRSRVKTNLGFPGRPTQSHRVIWGNCTGSYDDYTFKSEGYGGQRYIHSIHGH